MKHSEFDTIFHSVLAEWMAGAKLVDPKELRSFAHHFGEALLRAYPRVPEKREIWRHVKTGGLYSVVTTALNEANGGASQIVVYQSVTDGRIWARDAIEFNDGRFVKVEYEG